MDMATNYAEDFLINMSDEGMTEDLWRLAHKDSTVLSQLGIKNDKERNLYFYLENFYDDLIDEFGVEINVPKENVLAWVFTKLRNKENVDLTDIRRSVYEALRLRGKVAYPNITGIKSTNKKPKRDISKWIQTLGSIYAATQKGESRNNATERIMEGWDPMEKLDFEGWARYYEHGDHEKYGFQKSAETAVPNIPFVEPGKKESEDPEIDISMRRKPGRPRKTDRTGTDIKRSLISRLDSAKKLLREFVNVWPVDKWTHLDEMLSFLQREIVPLKTEATIRDRIIRTANLFEKEGFFEGANELRKVAQPPAGDVATQIEKALTGKEYDIGKPEESGPPIEEIPGLEEMPSAPPEEETMEEIGVPAGAGEKLPPEEPPPPPPEEEKEKPAEGKLFEGKTVKDVLDVLEPLSKKLSEREFVRELSKADMILDSMYIASHFPELAEAQAKALELNLYVTTRIEKIINKLRGGLTEEEEEKPKEKEVPSVEMKEKEMFEVEEEAVPPPPPPAPAVPGV